MVVRKLGNCYRSQSWTRIAIDTGNSHIDLIDLRYDNSREMGWDHLRANNRRADRNQLLFVQ